MLGKPAYKYGQTVFFKCDGRLVRGEIAVIDAYGTFFYSEDVCYDIYSEEHNCLFKHIPESALRTTKI